MIIKKVRIYQGFLFKRTEIIGKSFACVFCKYSKSTEGGTSDCAKIINSEGYQLWQSCLGCELISRNDSTKYCFIPVYDQKEIKNH